jgi:hypothetical protein
MFVPEKSMKLEAIRFVSLPSEIQNGGDVFQFMKNVLRMDATSVNIVPMQTNQGVRYRSAFADIAPTGEEDPLLIQALMEGFANIHDQNIPGGIHFDNGKPMSHIKIVPVKRHGASKEPLQLETGDWTSIYIPVIPEDLTMDNGDVRLNNEESLAEFFEDQLKIGKVSRIDFMSKPVPNSDRVAKCAYVHFDQWYDNHVAKLVRKTINDKGEFSCNGYYDGFEFCRFERNRYINFKVNHKPIPAATEDMNVHQLAARVKLLEEQNARLEERITEVQNENDDLKYMQGNAQLAADEYKLINQELSKPLTMEEAFKQLQKKMEEFKVVSNELMEKYGSNDAVEAAGVWELPEYKDYAFDYIGALNNLYNEFVPIILREM